MIQSDPHQAIRPWQAGKPASMFCVLGFGFLGTVVLFAEALFGSFIASVSLYLRIIAISLRGFLQCYPHDVLGTCNVVTLGRAALVSVLAGAVFVPVSYWVVFCIAATAFALDGVDGWLARRASLSSAFGARFDMEIDALLGAVLASILLVHSAVGPAILVLGFARYIFILVGLRWTILQGDLPESFRRKAICVVQITALLVLVFPLTPHLLVAPVSVFAAFALLYSFAADTIYLLRRVA